MNRTSCRTILSLAVASTALTVLAIGPSTAQTPPVADPPGCADILKAKTERDAELTFDRHAAKPKAEQTAVSDALGTYKGKITAALTPWATAEQELGRAEARLAELTNEATAYSVPWLKEELRKAKKELDELTATNKFQATERVKNLDQRLATTVEAEKLTRKNVEDLKIKVQKTKKDYDDTLKHEAEDRARLRDLDNVIGKLDRCRTLRVTQLDPAEAKHLPKIEAATAAFEQRAAEMEKLTSRAASVCAPARTAIPAIKKSAIELTAALRQLTADANAGALAPAPTIPQDVAAARQRARDAAARTSNLSKHAAEMAQSTCDASQIVKASPRDPLAAANLAEVQKRRLLAERDVELAAAALNEIRAAYAATGTAGAPPAAARAPGSLAAQLDALRKRSTAELGSEARVKAMVDLQTFLKEADAGHRAALKSAEDLRAILGALGASQSSTHWAMKVFGDRWMNVQLREKTALGAAACAVTLQTDLENAAKDMETASTALAAAEGAVASAEKKAIAADPRTEMELTFSAARDEADTVAAEAVKAVRCAVEAENAVKTAAPAAPAVAPPTGRGVKCTYFMSWEASPQPVQYEIVDYGGGDCPSIMNSMTTAASIVSGPPPAGSPWVGRWTGRSTWQIYGVGSTFVINVPWGKVSPFGTSWVAVCQTTGANTATCKGAGLFDGTDRVTSFTVALELTLNGNTINYRYQYPYADIKMKDRGAPSGGEIRSGGSGSGTANRQN